MADKITAAKTPRQMLASYDRFISGLPITDDEKATADAVAVSAAFAAAAYEHGFDRDQSTHAMARAFLCALINTERPDLDYLRANHDGIAPAANESGANHG